MFKYGTLIITFAMALSAQAANLTNVGSDGVAVHGYDPVTYFQDKGPQKGSDKIKTEVNGATYLFSKEENKKEFLKNPAKYEPQFGGWCAYAVANKKTKVDVDPKSYLIQDGRLLLFYNGLLADTRKKWTSDKDKSAANFLKDADAFWAEVKIKQEP